MKSPWGARHDILNQWVTTLNLEMSIYYLELTRDTIPFREIHCDNGNKHEQNGNCSDYTSLTFENASKSLQGIRWKGEPRFF